MTASVPDDDLRALFACAPPDNPVALAVSGGGDSMALLHLALRWSRLGGPALYALTVDHGLRPDSAGEAQAVAGFCAAQGIAHETLRWEEGRPGATGNLPDAARTARYTLMARACAARGIATLLTGHTLDDQAETVLLRLGRGSGVDGLAAMRPATALWGLRVVRPLLGMRRATLRDILAAEGIAWRDDPTNEDRRYARILARDALATLAPLGITAERLAGTATAMADARQVLDAAATTLAAELCTLSPLGYVLLDPARLARAPRETRHRLLSRLLCAVSGTPYRPRLEALTGLLDRMGGAGFGGTTLHGCRIDPFGTQVAIQREPSACTSTIPCASRGTWDDRFDITVPASLTRRESVTIAAAGAEGLRMLKAAKHPAPPVWTAAPRPARLCAPALWRGPDLLAIPLAGYAPAPEASECRAVSRVTLGTTMVDPDREAYI